MEGSNEPVWTAWNGQRWGKPGSNQSALVALNKKLSSAKVTIGSREMQMEAQIAVYMQADTEGDLANSVYIFT